MAAKDRQRRRRAGPPALSVRGLSVAFAGRRGTALAVNDVSFDVEKGQTVALVGESGCGKSVTSLSIMGLLPRPGRITGGQILYRGFEGDPIDLARADRRALRRIRGVGVSMVFQEPMTALNPSFTVGFQIAEAIRRRRRIPNEEVNERARALLAQVGIPEPGRRLREYPHQLSGGMRQRAMIAMAAACRPALLIADEPTTALDVTTQTQVLAMLKDLQTEIGMGVLFITHNLAVAQMIADRVIVMYAGQIVEEGPGAIVLDAPRHPYTKALLACLPARHLPRELGGRIDLPSIAGEGFDPFNAPSGCAFSSRCALALDRCRTIAPDLAPIPGEDRSVRCVRMDGL